MTSSGIFYRYKNILQQAKDYAQTLGAKFAFATNGKTILEHNYVTGKETRIDRFPSPDELVL